MLKAFGWKKETELEKSVKRLKANDPSLTALDLGSNSIGNEFCVAFIVVFGFLWALLYANLIVPE